MAKNRPRRRAEQAPGGLEEEIAMARQAVRRLHSMAGDDYEVKELLLILDGLSKSAARLALLLKAQRELEAEAGPAQALIDSMEAVLASLSAEDGGREPGAGAEVVNGSE